ncbi:MAG: pectin acetylesterase-family hydrolase [Candidatus Azotimanducaceae bacterium]|jgi:glyoxylase-like metal-dependent hydrolase (beta-lactamase superfamily II)
MQYPTFRRRFATLLAIFVFSACQPESTTPASDAPQSTGTPTEASATPTDWQKISPAANTTCSDGSPYSFFVRQGDPNKLLVYFQGGGACWFRQNCDPQMSPSYSIQVGNIDRANFGIFNLDNPDNPFKDHTTVFAPYCTADVHMGASDTVYPPVEEGQTDLVIRHQGRANVEAVLQWTYEHVPSPQSIFVTGSSAGAIPSPLYTALIADHYVNARIAQLGDGAGGYRRTNNDSRPDEQWGTFDFITQEQGFANLRPETMTYESLYIAAAQAHPDITFAEYDAAEDAVQKRFLSMSGQKDVALQQAIEANHADIRREVGNFSSYIAGGDSHTILGRPEFYTLASNGVAIRDWVAALANFETVENVTCAPCDIESFSGAAMPPAVEAMWASWEDRRSQYVEPFQIFDNVYYVGIDWVAAYLIETGDGLILIDSLYGSWLPVLLNNIRELGFDPADVKYLINTHGHFDHAGGSALFQKVYGSRVVMTAEDWQVAQAKPELAAFYMPTPRVDMVAEDGDTISLGDNTITLYKTPGHTEGVLSLGYTGKDGDDTHSILTLGGVGLNFSGIERTETYLDSYRRLQSMQDSFSVSLPNHQSMGRVFDRRDLLAQRQAGQAHPFVDKPGLSRDLASFIAAAESKLELEKAGNAPDPLAALQQAISDEE